MSSLPIADLFAALRQKLTSHKQIIIEAPTGAGKSTALPLEMLGWPEITGRILMLEPRRVATRSVAQFIAKQLNQAVGETVGYRVRGESKVSRHTRLEIVTEGILTRMIQDDPELTGIDIIIFDEIHERHLTTDLGLALALEVQQSLRDDLRLIAMSATLTGLPLEGLMPEAAKLISLGRSFKVDIEYRPVPSQQQWLDYMGRVIVELLTNPIDHKQANSEVFQGGLLAFLPGKGEIQRLASVLSQRLDPLMFQVCPLYGELSPAEQDKAISPAKAGVRKVVLATNVAESSLTISDITLVVDSGYKRGASFNPRTGVTRLGLKRISQASAVQRSGRAGRVAQGFGIRLWSQEEQGRLLAADEAEIATAELVSMALECAAWGVSDCEKLPLLSAPPAVHEQLSWQLLQRLELVDEGKKITALGQAAHALGCHPRLGHMLLKAKAISATQSIDSASDFSNLACLLAAIIEARGLPRKGADISGYLALATQGSMGQQARNWQRKLALSGSLERAASQANNSDISLLLALAFPDRIAKARGKEGFLLSNGTGVTLDAADPLSLSPWLVVADFQENEGRSAGRVYLAAELDMSLFDDELAYLVSKESHCGWDEIKGRFFGENRYRLGHIIVKTQTGQVLDAEGRTAALIALLREKGLSLVNFDEAVIQLQNRVQLARIFAPEYDWPSMDEAALLAELEHWLGPYLSEVNNLTKLSKLNLLPLLSSRLSWELNQKLEILAPTHWPMATGTRAPISYHYQQDGTQNQAQARLSVRLQEAYGLSQSPVLFNGKLTVTMALLSPAQRPLALTSDLASFWNGPYVDVKKEMRGRYPKHLWPDDPINTVPTKFTKKKTPGLN
ncbi:ATP-dependent helicase HrpB [Shewanella denitrificans OS217]|uniref:ATP-dependent helicase HrpB n=1 Tax=Shewanella denitrificans (strain OS217 / ATCC BAA-1090 / DSM 15013) TaxID=318161 RepID=Q12JD5_SHEDO|nr:ATP-dependent helicase HrpB [Shewanella denitrificans]ABE56441.1 ATP-dependent helicase HrpB [Shewanella denitrificans OS217]